MTEARRVVGRWQMLFLSINDVVGSGVYLLPAAAFALLGGFSLWAVPIAGLAALLLVLCYARLARYYDQQGGSYLYARDAFGPFVGFQVGWTIWLTRISVAAAFSHGLADAMSHAWPAFDSQPWRSVVVVGSLALLTFINVLGVRWAAWSAVVLSVGKLVPLLLLIVLAVPHIDPAMAFDLSDRGASATDPRALGTAVLLLLFAYAGFENLAVAAGEYRAPRRNIPFALMLMVLVVTLLYTSVQFVAQGVLPGLAESKTPLADAAEVVGGPWLALLLTSGAVLSILGTSSNTMFLGPRFAHSLAMDGYGPRLFAQLHPTRATPAWAICLQGGVALVLALTGSFVQLALLSMATRVLGYLSTAAAVMVLRRRHGDHSGAWNGRAADAVALLVIAILLPVLASIEPRSLLMVAAAMGAGCVLYLLRRKPA